MFLIEMLIRVFLSIVFYCVGASAVSVWPPPKSLSTSGPRRALHPAFQLSTSLNVPILDANLQRYNRRLTRTLGGLKSEPEASLQHLFIDIANPENTTLGLQTDYSYVLTILEGSDGADLTAASVYGAIYGLETFLQLIGSDGFLEASSVHVEDAPQYAWRGLMIDSGRRFFPVALVKNLMDTMVAVKLNVLHLHAADHCRFGVESKLYPQLTQALVGDRAGHYTQDDIKDLIAYGKERGIRVVPEFDIPGHTHGLIPLESAGVEFCSNESSRTQIYNDPANVTYSVLEKLLGEMSSLFEDEVFNIGCDETSAKGKCTVEDTFALERKMIQTISSNYGKTPQGWEEILFVENAATQETIVNAWSRENVSEITATGRRAVESSSKHFYFTHAAPGGPPGWSKCHYDIVTGVPEAQKKLVLGGEISMWSDDYCYIAQCGTYNGPPPVAHALFPPSADVAFAQSIGGMIWPRGFVAAGAFWNYQASSDPTSADFQKAIYKINDEVRARGGLVCPSNCSCDEVSACGKPYLSTEPPELEIFT